MMRHISHFLYASSILAELFIATGSPGLFMEKQRHLTKVLIVSDSVSDFASIAPVRSADSHGSIYSLQPEGRQYASDKY